MGSIRIESKTDNLDPTQSREGRLLPVIMEQSSILDSLVQGKSLNDFSSKELVTIGLTYNEKSDYLKAREAFKLALEKLSQEKLTPDEKTTITAHCRYGLAILERELGNDNIAILGFILAASECSKINHETKEYASLNYDIERNLGIAFLNVKEFENAANFFKMAVNGAEKIRKTGLIPAVTSYLGLALVLSGDHKNGFLQLEKARQLYPIDTREKSMDWAAHRYHMGRAYQEAGDFVNAIAEYMESLRLRLQTSPQVDTVYFNSRVGDIHAGLGQSYFYLNQINSAKKWLNKAIENYQALNNMKKIDEPERLLKAIADLEKSNTKKRYLQYGLGTSLHLGVGLFALWNRGTANTTKDALSNSFLAKNGR